MIRTVAGPVYGFFADGDPKSQGSMRAFRGRIVHTSGPALKAWRLAVNRAGACALPPDWDNSARYMVRLSFNLRRPKYHYTSKGALRAQYETALPGQRPDLDKLIRAVLDALTPLVWRDDSQVIAIHAVKAWAGERPGLAASIHILEETHYA